MTQTVEQRIAEARQLRNAGAGGPALAAYQAAAEQAAAEASPGLRAHALRHVADLAREQGAIETALTAAAEAVALTHALGAPALDRANALRVHALTLQAQAQQLWAQAGALYEQAGVPEGVAEARTHLT